MNISMHDLPHELQVLLAGGTWQTIASGLSGTQVFRSLTYNFGPGWEPLFWEAFGLQTVDPARIEFYQLLDEFF